MSFTIRKVLGLGAIVGVCAGAPGLARAAVYSYVDWTSTDVAHGTASGTITLPDTSTVAVTFKALTSANGQGSLYGAQTAGSGTNYWVPSAPYLSAQVENAPPSTDILQLSGGMNETYVVTLSEPIKDPIMAIVSLGQPTVATTYNFDSPFTIVSQGEGYWGGTATSLVALPNNILEGNEGHGTIQFVGTFSTFSWTVPTPETWHGFTFGIRTTQRIEPGMGGTSGSAGISGSAGSSGSAGVSGSAGSGGGGGTAGGAGTSGGGNSGTAGAAGGQGGTVAGGAGGAGGTAGASATGGAGGGGGGRGGGAGAVASGGAGGLAGAGGQEVAVGGAGGASAGGMSGQGGGAIGSAGTSGAAGHIATGSAGKGGAGGTVAAGGGGKGGAGGKAPGDSNSGCDCSVDVSGRGLGIAGLLGLATLVLASGRRSRRKRAREERL